MQRSCAHRDCATLTTATLLLIRPWSTTLRRYNRAVGSFVINPTSWAGTAPARAPARVVAGRLSDDGEYISAQFKLDPQCTCLSKADDGGNGLGKSCGIHVLDGQKTRNGVPWCYVDDKCAQSKLGGEDWDGDGAHWAPCDNDFKYYQQCSTVNLARVCPAEANLCEPGWTRNKVQNRCYKLFADEGKTFDDANSDCEDMGGHLVSIHSAPENSFVASLLTDGQVQTAYLGLQGETGNFFQGRSWLDQTPLGFTVKPADRNWEACFTISNTGSWESSKCDVKAPFVCRKLPLGKKTDCECTGVSDEAHRGGYCKQWDSDKAPWCYVSSACIRSVRSQDDQSGLSKAICDDGSSDDDETTTTTRPTMVDTCFRNNDKTYMDKDGECQDCKTQNDCGDDEVLVGECGEHRPTMCKKCRAGTFKATNRPVCIDCDVRCNTCFGPRAGQCLSCDGSDDSDNRLPLHLRKEDGKDYGPCVSDCHENDSGLFKNQDKQICEKCTECEDGFFIETACSEFSDTVCEKWSGCESDEWEVAEPTKDKDRACRAVSECSCGTIAQATAFTDAECVVCTTTVTTTETTTTITTTVTTTPTQTVPTTTIVCNECADDEYYSSACDIEGGHPGVCKKCTKCTSDEWEKTACTEDADTVCAFPQTCRCTACDSQFSDELSYYESEDYTPTTDRVCEVHTPCASDEWAVVKATPTANRVCKRVEPCPEGQYVSKGIEEINDPDDVVCSACPTGTFSNAATQAQCEAHVECPQACVDHADICDVGEFAYYGSGDKSTTKRQCKPCKAGYVSPGVDAEECTMCEDGTFANGDKCEVHSGCGVGYENVQVGTTTQDTRCQKCADGYFKASNDPDEMCQPVSDCAEGEYEFRLPDSMTDRDCRPCGEGEFRTADMPVGSCAQHSSYCGKGQQQSKAPSATSDRVCEDCPPGTFYSQNRFSRLYETDMCQEWSVCKAGEYQRVQGTKESDTRCSDCRSRTFSDQDNMKECINFSDCEPGQFILEDGTEKSDRICKQCDPSDDTLRDGAGFTTVKNSYRCEPVTRCKIGYEEDEPPTPMSDRTCRRCAADKSFQDEPNQKECKDATECLAGEEETDAVSLTADRTCSPCKSNTYKKDQGSVKKCVAKSVCGEGKGLTGNLDTPSADRQCSACRGKTFQPFTIGTCQPCVLGVSFAASGATKCSWVALLNVIKVEVAFDVPVGLGGRRVRKDVKTNNIKSALQDKLGDIALKIEPKNNLEAPGASIPRNKEVVVMAITVTTSDWKKLVSIAYLDVGGLDITVKLKDEDFVVMAMPNTLAITGPADPKDQSESCTVLKMATLTSDRQCKESGGTADRPTTITEGPQTKPTKKPTESPGGGDSNNDDFYDDNEDTKPGVTGPATDAPTTTAPGTEASKSKSDDGGDTTTIVMVIVVVVIIVVILIVVLAVVLVKKSAGQTADARNTQSFENPMYEASGPGAGVNRQMAPPPNGATNASGYMDVPAGGAGMANGSGYMDIPAGGAGTTNQSYMEPVPIEPVPMQSKSGYMDVDPSHKANDAGYMDVSNDVVAPESEDEDV